MRNKIKLLCRKELLDWFYSIKTYLGLTAYLALCGYMINNYVSTHNLTNIEGVLPNLMLLLSIFIPLMCTISLNKEYKFGTRKIMVASPTTTLEIVIAKFISIYIITLLGLIINLIQFSLVRCIDVISFRILASTFIGYAILAFAIIAISMMLSTFTNNGYANYTISFVTMTIIFMLSFFYKYIPPYLSGIYAFFSIFTDIKAYWLVGKGNLYPVIHSLTVTFICLYVTIKRLDKRWQDD